MISKYEKALHNQHEKEPNVKLTKEEIKVVIPCCIGFIVAVTFILFPVDIADAIGGLL